MVDLFVSSARQIIRDSYERKMLGVAGGVWYASDYYRKTNTPLLEFFHGHASSDAVQLVADPKSPTGKRPLCFVLKEGVLPSAAVQTIEAGLSFLDCATVMQLALYKAFLALLGKEKFDRLFADFRLSTDGSSPVLKFLSKKEIAGEQEVRRGDICYFSNVPEYVTKHPAGASRGDYVLCVSENPHLYIGFGFSDRGMDRKGVEYELWDCFNTAPLDEGYYPPWIWNHLYSHYHRNDLQKAKALIDAFRDAQWSWEDFQKRPSRLQMLGLPCDGKMGLWVYRIDSNSNIYFT